MDRWSIVHDMVLCYRGVDVHSECRGMLTNGVVLHHDKARPHMTTATVQTIWKLKFEFLPAYCPYLAPSDYHIFGPFKDALRGCRSANDGWVKNAVLKCLCAQRRTFFAGSSCTEVTDIWRSYGMTLKNASVFVLVYLCRINFEFPSHMHCPSQI
jgi:hypothetical protein